MYVILYDKGMRCNEALTLQLEMSRDVYAYARS